MSGKYKEVIGLTIDDDENFDTLPSLVEHYQKDADGLCTKLREYPINKSLNEVKMKNAFSDHGWTIEKEELTMDTFLGKGEFGDVRLGLLRGLKVAVKTLNDKRVATQSILAEACTMTALIHENLVSFLGIVFDDSILRLVTEYMSKGSLVEYLRTRGRILISPSDQINFACDVAKGMVFMESKKYVHRDLAARNVLLHENGTAKVADFGLTIKMDPNLKTFRKFPIKWTAPEALKNNVGLGRAFSSHFGVPNFMFLEG
ncbi:UNVERIFIED_CONTAM: hypothetical protein GTU68_045215 [Idotea baltica]|nr:hypothetical protein [Idotea baltica]